MKQCNKLASGLLDTHGDSLLFDSSHRKYLSRCIDHIVGVVTTPTFPVRDTSPVMATFCLNGVSVARERRADTMVHPADGPSLGVAPWKEECT